MFKTSGSSGASRWVVHRRESLLQSAAMVVEHLQITADDIWYLALPVYHVGGFGVLARAYVSGCQIVHQQGRWEVDLFLSGLRDSRATIVSLVPTQVVDLVRSCAQCPPCLRAAIIGGGHLQEEVRQAAVALGWPILLSYGMTETGSQIATQRVPSGAGDRLIDLIDGWEVRVGPSGLLEVKGAGLMRGYLEESGDGYSFQFPFHDGWFTTSDYVSVDGRKIEFQRRGGRKVKVLGELVDLDALEMKISEALETDVYLVAVDDERRGAALVPVLARDRFVRESFDALDLRGIYRLESPVLLDAIPRNPMGKLDRVKLVESVVISRRSV